MVVFDARPATKNTSCVWDLRNTSSKHNTSCVVDFRNTYSNKTHHLFFGFRNRLSFSTVPIFTVYRWINRLRRCVVKESSFGEEEISLCKIELFGGAESKLNLRTSAAEVRNIQR